MAEFRALLHGRVREGKVGAYRNLAERLTSFVRENEPGTVVYGWFLSEDGRFINEEVYSGQVAFFAHMANVQEQGFLDEYTAIVEVESVQLLGDIGDDVRDAVAQSAPVQYSKIEGF